MIENIATILVLVAAAIALFNPKVKFDGLDNIIDPNHNKGRE